MCDVLREVVPTFYRVTSVEGAGIQGSDYYVLYQTVLPRVYGAPMLSITVYQSQYYGS